MSVPWAKRLSGRAEVRHFPVTNGPLMLLLPNRAGVPIYGQPRPTVVMMQPPVTPLPPPPAPRPPVEPITVTYVNQSQSCTNTCPDGSTGEPITVTVPAGEYTSEVSQDAANAEAMAAACAEAAAQRTLNPCVESEAPGSLWGWGYNVPGLLGMGDLAARYSPDRVGQVDELTWIKVEGSFGNTHVLGLKEDGALYAWGTNFFGELGQGNIATTAGSPFNLNFPTRVGLAEYIDCSAGENFTVAIKSDGTLWACGRNQSGQLAQGDTTTRSTLTQVGSANNWTSVAAGLDYFYAVNADGEVWAAGKSPMNDGGVEEYNLIQVSSEDGFSKMSAALAMKSLGIKGNGTLWEFTSWFSTPTQLGVVDTWVDISALYLKREDGTLWEYSGSVAQFGTDADWDKFASLESTVIATKTDGTLWGWGFNFFGGLGQGTADGSFTTTPVQIGPDNLWINVGIGGFCSFGMRSTTAQPPPPAIATGIAEGGAISLAGGYAIHRFDYNLDFVVTNNSGKTFEWMLVGGGGEGGGLGGGAGAEILLNSGGLADGDYPVQVGVGGRHPLPQFDPPNTVGDDGDPSTFNGDSAAGGKGGGAFGSNLNGQNGTYGSGGGAASPEGSGNGAGGTGTFNGGSGSATASFGRAGGGGAGSTASGTNASSTGTSSTGGNGGAGTASTFGGTGSVRYSAGGGGGAGAGSPQTQGTGGNSVGGVGGKTEGGLIPGSTGLSPGSGGGGGTGSTPFDGGPGARGVVFIRYLYP